MQLNLQRDEIDELKGFLCLRAGAAHKNKKRLVSAQVALAMRFKKNSLPVE